MSKDMLDFISNDFYKPMIKYEGIRGGFFSIKSLFASFGLLILIAIIPDIFKETPNIITAEYKLIDILLMFFVFLSSLYLLFKSFHPLYFYFKSKSWNEVNAYIDNIYISKVKLVYYLHTGISYTPKVRYQFIIEGKVYKGDRLSFENKKFENSLDPYTSSKYDEYNYDFGNWIDSKKIKVYYNPKNPNQSVVYRNLNVFSLITYSFVFLFFSSVFLIVFLRIFFYFIIKE